jgi:hypothetical protein
MSRMVTMLLALILVIGGAIAGLYFFYSSTERGTARIARVPKERREARFAAQFDSLTKARLYPTVWRAGTFLKTAFNEDYTEWTLTISSADWKHRDEDSRHDLGASLYATFQGVRAQAGGDPAEAVLIIQDEHENLLLRISEETGTIIYD